MRGTAALAAARAPAANHRAACAGKERGPAAARLATLGRMVSRICKVPQCVRTVIALTSRDNDDTMCNLRLRVFGSKEIVFADKLKPVVSHTYQNYVVLPVV